MKSVKFRDKTQFDEFVKRVKDAEVACGYPGSGPPAYDLEDLLDDDYDSFDGESYAWDVDSKYGWDLL